MAARSRELRVVISGDAKGLNRAFGQVEKGAGQAETRMHGFGAKVSSAFKLAGAAIAGAEIASQIKETITAAKDAQVAHARLAAQLKAVGISYGAHSKQITEVIDKTSALSGITGKDLEGALTSVVRGTGNLKDGLHGVAIAADLARAKHMDVAKAGDLVAKVYNGNVGALKRMGISLTPVTTAQDKLKESTKHATVEQQRAAKEADKTATAQKALGLLQRRVGGQAEAYGKTAAGAQDRFRAAVERLREQIGAKLLPIIAQVAGKAADFVTQMEDGKGAGGRFAAKLKEVADRIKPIAKFFTDHPKIIAIAIAAWAAYRVAAALAMAATRLKALGMFKGLARPAAVGGAEAGAAFGTAEAEAANTRMAAGTATGLRGLVGRMPLFGRMLGGALGTAIMFEVAKNFDGPTWQKILQGIMPFQPRGSNPLPKPGGPQILLPNPMNPLPKGSPTGTTPLKPSRSPSGSKTPLPKTAHTSSVRAHAASVTAHAARAGGAPLAGGLAQTLNGRQIASLWIGAGGDPGAADMAVAIAFAESGGRTDASSSNPVSGGTNMGLWQIDSGSHANATFDPAGNAAAAVGISGNGRNWGAWETYVTGAYKKFLGRSGTGTGGSVPSLAAASGGSTKKARPKITTVALEHGQSGKPKGMGAAFPKGVTGFQAGLTAGQIADLSADPQTSQKARNMRLFALGVRKNKIISDLQSGKVKDPATRKRLLGELADNNSETADLLKPIGGDLTGTDAIPGATAYLSSLGRQAAEAALTPDTADDTDVAKRTLAARQAIYDYEKARPGQFSDDDIAQAATDLKSAKDAVDQSGQAQQDLVNALNGVRDELKKQNDFATQVTSVSLGQAWKAMADMISGQIAGIGYSGRALTAGDGSIARY